MADKQATINVNLNGAEEVISTVGKINQAFSGVGGTTRKAFRDAGAAVGGALRGVAADVARTITVVNTLNFARAVASAKEYETAVARIGVATNRSVDEIKGRFSAVSESIAVPVDQLQAWTATVGRITYDFKGAEQSVAAFGREALAAGRSVEEYQGLAEALSAVGVKGGDVEDVLHRIRGQVKSFGGGEQDIAKVHDRLVQMSGALQNVDMKRAGASVTAFTSQFGRGLAPGKQAQAQQAALSLVTGDPRGIEFFLGEKITDERGMVTDPIGVMKRYREKLVRRLGRRGAERAFRNRFGDPVLAAAMMNADFDAMDKGTAVPGVAPDAALLKTEAGARLATDARARNAELGVGAEMLPYQNMFAKFAADHPFLAKGLEIGGTGLVGGLGRGAFSFVKGMLGLGGAGGAGAGTAAGGGGGMGTAIGATLGGVGLASVGALVGSVVAAPFFMADIGKEAKYKSGFALTELDEKRAGGLREKAAAALTGAEAKRSAGMTAALEAEKGMQARAAERREQRRAVRQALLSEFVGPLSPQQQTIKALIDAGATKELAEATAKALGEELRKGPLIVSIAPQTPPPNARQEQPTG